LVYTDSALLIPTPAELGTPLVDFVLYARTICNSPPREERTVCQHREPLTPQDGEGERPARTGGLSLCTYSPLPRFLLASLGQLCWGGIIHPV